MRPGTTITLHDDVAAQLDHEAQKTGTAPEELANDVLRRNLTSHPEPQRKFVVRARDLGARPDANFDCAWKLLDQIDGPDGK